MLLARPSSATKDHKERFLQHAVDEEPEHGQAVRAVFRLRDWCRYIKTGSGPQLRLTQEF